MLLRFRVENHASLLQEQELSLVAADRDDDNSLTFAVPGSGLRALPVTALFGANASGKSNVVRALSYLRQAVLDSHRRWQPGGGVQRLPFLLAEDGRERPSTFAVDIVVDEVRHEYGFSVDDHRVLAEWLYSYPHRKRRKLFVRDGDDFDYGDTFRGERKLIEHVVRPNSLYLSAGASNNHPVLGRLYQWFHRRLRIATDANYTQRFGETMSLWSGSERDQIDSLLRYADTGAETFEVSEEATSEEEMNRVLQLLRLINPENYDEADVVQSLKSRRSVRLAHRATGGALVTLDPELESSGTRTWTGLLGPVVSALNDGSVLVVDELDARLHPLLAARLVRLFQERQSNPRGAQLIFNTHDTTLLAPTSEARLRRDQVWLTEKSQTDDGTVTQGATELVALLEYRPRDRGENLEKRYLAGRYGALPHFDEELVESLSTGRETAR
ncbi:AAA family ATPase [Streptomyces alkaliterrae]|uniref:ATP-binding protein n=1 Tax=Streptomyces alkaliterrae TaxID=2213162 RepID=A0A7W3WXX2_9ACTN|nr:ATP-binding protein [Streptomyces alkaliterrae]MBB1260300.1 ATP-binding protein [Streptomyces alkaliterrae]